MKRIFIKLIFILFLSIPIYSHSNDFIFFIQPEFNLTVGKLGEYLYSDQSHTSLRSYLEWQEIPLISPSIKAGANWKNLHLDFKASYGIPLACGKMYDKDWNGNLQSNLGVFDNKIKQYYDFYANLFYTFNISSNFTISPSLITEYSYIAFSPENGRGWYGDWKNNIAYDSPLAQQNIKLYPVYYFRKNLMFFIGADFSYSYKKWIFNSGIYTSVYSRIYAEDFHSANGDKDREYTMIILNNNLFSIFRFNICAEYKLSHRFLITSNVSATISPILKAESATDFYRGLSFGSNGAVETKWEILGFVSGADIQNFTFDLGFKYFF